MEAVHRLGQVEPGPAVLPAFLLPNVSGAGRPTGVVRPFLPLLRPVAAAVGNQQIRRLLLPEVESHPQGGLPLRGRRSRGRVGAPGKQRLHHLGITGESRRVQQRPAARLAAHVRVVTPVQQLRNPLSIPGEHRLENAPFLCRRLRPGGGGPLPHPVRQRDEGQQADRQRKGHPPEAVGQERLQAAAAPQHGGEESAHQEEHRHAETVHRPEELVVEAAPARRPVLHPPEARKERQGGVQADAQQHGEAPQSVEVAAAALRGRSPVHRRRGGCQSRTPLITAARIPARPPGAGRTPQLDFALSDSPPLAGRFILRRAARPSIEFFDFRALHPPPPPPPPSCFQFWAAREGRLRRMPVVGYFASPPLFGRRALRF